MHLDIKRFAAIVTMVASACTLEAGSATWNLNPVNNHWSKAPNWTPATVPNGPDDVATLGTSDVTEILLGAPDNVYSIVTVAGIVFEPDASAYTITVMPVVGADSTISFEGAGFVNNSGTTQNLVAANSGQELADSGRIYFLNASSAGENVVITNQGSASDVPYGAGTAFWNSSTAANATIINEGATVSGTIYGGFTDLLDYSSAENATFINNPGTVSGAAAGHTLIQTFLPGGNLGTSAFIANPATVPGAEGGWVEMDVGTCSGTSFIANGASVADCQAGQIYAYGAEYGTGLGVATFTGNGGNGTNPQGGLIDGFNFPPA